MSDIVQTLEIPDITTRVFKFLPDIRALRVNRRLDNAAKTYKNGREYNFWINYKKGDIFCKNAKVKMLNLIEINLRHFSAICGRGNVKIVRKFVSLGADILTSADHTLQYVATEGHLEVLKYLVSLGANIRADDDLATTLASAKGHLDVVKYLVSQSADVQAGNNKSILLASAKGHLNVIKYLVSQGADARVRNDGPLKLASFEEYHDVVAYLISQGAVL